MKSSVDRYLSRIHGHVSTTTGIGKENRCQELIAHVRGKRLRSVAGAEVALDDVAELLLAVNLAMSLRLESSVEQVVGHTYPPVRAQRIVVGTPRRFDVVELVEAEPGEVSGAGEFHPSALIEPDMHVSALPAPISRGLTLNFRRHLLSVKRILKSFRGNGL